jgi:hypothetical protein
MMVRVMKRIAFFCFLSSLIFAIIFHQTILNSLTTWSLQTYAVSKWGKTLEYEKLYRDGTRIVILQPRFKNEASFAAEQLVLDFNFNWWKRRLHINIDIEQPHWHLQTPFSLQWENWKKLLNREETWIKTDPSFRIKTGLLTWAADDSLQHQQLHFDLEANSQEGGFIKLYFEDEESVANCLTLQVLSSGRGMQVNCSCQNISCPSLFTLGQFVGFNVPSSWRVTSGFLQGELKIIFPGKRRPYLEGELFVEQLTFNQIEASLIGQVEQARLKLEKNQIAYELNDQVPTVIGQLDILKPASLAYQSLQQGWTIHQIEGSIQLNNIETALIDLKARRDDLQHPSHWNLQGKANLNAQRSLNLDLVLSCSSLEQPGGKIHLSFHQPPTGNKCAEVQLEKISHTECDFLQTLLATYWPVFNEVKLEKGELNAFVKADVTDQGIGELHIKQFQASHLCSKVKSWNARCCFAQMRGHGKVNLEKEDFWQTVHAGFHVEDGEMQFEGISPPLPLTNIQAHLLIQQGHVEHSLITLQLAGLKGNMDVEWKDHKQLLTFKLDGIVQDLAELLPNALQEGLRQNFYDNRLIVLANLKRQNQQLELGGTLHIQRSNSDRMDLVHFGCELKKMDRDSVSKCIPFGWFHAHHLPLEKFLSPFIFRNGILRMSGEAEFKGSFDDHCLTIKYDAENLKLENEDLCIEIKDLHAHVPGQLIGSHQFDLRNSFHQGTLPIQHASYFEKNSGLVFQDIQGIIAFKDQVIHILPIEAYCEGVYFAGDLELDYSDPAPGVFKLKIHCPTLSGNISQIQHLLAHLDQPSLLHKIPLEGEVSAKEEGLKLDFDFVPKDYHLQADIRGTITNGSWSFEDADMALKGIYMDVDYHHQQQLLEFSDIQGTLLVGKPRRVEEYFFLGNYVRLFQIAQPNIELDIAVKDHENELVRLVGYTREEKEGVKSLHFDQNLSHMSCIYPHIWQCHLKDWSTIEQLEFRSQFDLGIFLQDLQRFRQTGLLFLSHSMIEKLSQFLPLEGCGSIAIHHHPDQSYTYELEGSQIKQNGGPKHYGFLKGSKQDKKWIIDQIQWNDLSAYAELQQTADKWKIPFLGLHAGQTLLLGLEGDFIPNEGLIRAKLNLCEINLANLDCYQTLHSFVTKWWPKGNLKAKGEIEWTCFSSNSWEGFKASLLAEIDHLSLRDYPLGVLQPFQIEFQGSENFCLQNVRFELPPKNAQAFIDIKRFDYLPIQDSLSHLKLIFQIPSTQLETVGLSLHHHFPDIVDDSIKNLIISCKEQGQLKGTLTIENEVSSRKFLRLSLDDGLYKFKKQEYDLKQLELQMNGDELRFSALSQQERYPFQIVGQTQWPSCQQGQCTLIDPNASQAFKKPLLIKWKNHPEQGLSVQSVQGEFSGCSFLLEKSQDSLQSSEWKALQGQVTLDFNRLCPLLSSQMVEIIQKLKIGSLYTLMGHFWLNPDLGNSLLEIVSFQGSLVSDEAILKGYQVQKVQADLQYVPGRFDIQNLLIQDPAGSVKSANLVATLDRGKDQWTLFVPHLTVKNLRLCLLRDTESPYVPINSKFRSLLVKRIDLQDFSGALNKLDTWQAQGNLHFLNPSRKNLFHPLFAIPAEIILRLGLDPQVLNPVTGIIYFNLRGDRFYLTRFKDVYSEGRGSKFYLAQGKNFSWMDFNGNLCVQVRMKQYNLIFKIVELFTVSIQGNIKKPRYILQKQSRTQRKEQPLSVLSFEK